MTNPSHSIFLVLTLLALVTACASLVKEPTIITIWVGEHQFQVELADTIRKQANGLKGRTELTNNKGMLFPMKRVKKVTFGMNYVQMNLTAYWINENKTVIGMTKMKPCTRGKCESYRSPVEVAFVLELNDSDHGIQIGDKLRLGSESLKEP